MELSSILDQSITLRCPNGCSTKGSETSPTLGMLLHGPRGSGIHQHYRCMRSLAATTPKLLCANSCSKQSWLGS